MRKWPLSRRSSTVGTDRSSAAAAGVAAAGARGPDSVQPTAAPTIIIVTIARMAARLAGAAYGRATGRG